VSEDAEVGTVPGLITEVPAHLRGQSAPPPTLRGGAARFAADVALPGAPGMPDVPDASDVPGTGRDAPDEVRGDTVAVRREQPEERTRVRANGPMRQPTGVTVPAVWCPAGHFSPPDAPYCRTCGQPVPPQQPMRVPRPPLGTLHLPEGHRVLLDRPVVLGRRPQPVPDSDPWPHLVELPGELTHLSRNHLAVELDGWHVLARDLGSSGGTALHAPGRAPIRLRPHDPHVLEPGQSLVLSGDFTVVFVAATT
jgi:hypothetical protein